jgi:hypothetical protein
MKKLILSLFTLFFSTLIIAQIEPELSFDSNNNYILYNANNIKKLKIIEFEPQFGFKELDSLSKLGLIKNKVEIHYDSTRITKLIKEDKGYGSNEEYELLYDTKGRVLEKTTNRSSSSDKELYRYNEDDNSATMFYHNDFKRKKDLTKYDRATKYTFKDNKTIKEVIDNKYSKDEIIYKYNKHNDLIYRKGQYVTTTFAYVYDSQSRLIKKREKNNSGLDRTEAYKYLENGLLTKRSNVNIKSNLRSSTIYYYDERNYLTKTETKGKNINDYTVYENDKNGNWLKKEMFRDNKLKYYFERVIIYNLNDINFSE